MSECNFIASESKGEQCFKQINHFIFAGKKYMLNMLLISLKIEGEKNKSKFLKLPKPTKIDFYKFETEKKVGETEKPKLNAEILVMLHHSYHSGLHINDICTKISLGMFRMKNTWSVFVLSGI